MPHSTLASHAPLDRLPDTPPLENPELVRLQSRVIALENLVTALMADATDGQLERVRALAADIQPRAGHTPHPLTLQAAALMVHWVQRSQRLDPGEAS
jgi:hypothetical protein